MNQFLLDTVNWLKKEGEWISNVSIVKGRTERKEKENLKEAIFISKDFLRFIASY
jgi:hypothetical protein